MKISSRTWIDLALVVGMAVMIALVLEVRIGLRRNTDLQVQAALDVVHVALDLDQMAHEELRENVPWPGDQWTEKLHRLRGILDRPELRNFEKKEILDRLDHDQRALAQWLTDRQGVPAAQQPPSREALANTLFLLTRAQTVDGLGLEDASHAVEQRRDSSENRWVMAAVLLLGSVIVLISHLQGRRIVKSLTGLRQCAEVLAESNLTYHVQERGPAEIVELARSINTMADRLRESRRALEQELETRSREWGERERLMEQIDHQRAYFQAVIDLSPAGIAAFASGELRLKWANRAFLDFLDEPMRSQDLRGRRLEEMLPRVLETRLPEILHEVAASRGAFASDTELEFPSLSRGMTYWRWNVAALTVEDPPDLLLVVLDLTEPVRVRKQLAEVATCYEQSNRAKDDFLAMLGHELRNPLAPIRNSLYVLQQRGGITGESQRHSLTIIERQIGNMTRLVDDLLDISRISRGKIELHRERLELGEMLTQAVESTSALLESRHHELTVALPPESIEMDADPGRLEQILVNLMTNAAKYTEPGGHVWLGAERRGEEAVIRVRDNGVGIEPEMMPRLFEPFSQAQRSMGRSQGGLGLGLALVNSLVQLHGGRVEVQSDGPGKGSEFTVILPALPRTEVQPRRTAVDEPDANRVLRILVVEDNPDTADSMGELLELWGHTIALAPDGPTAIERAFEFQPDVALLDIGLPGMDGYEVARRLRERVGFLPMLLVAISGYGQGEDRERSRDSGIQHHFTKPIDLQALHDLLAGFSRHRACGRNV